MTVSAYHQDVLTLLRVGYDVIDAQLSYDSNHLRVTFTYVSGESRHVTLHNTFMPELNQYVPYTTGASCTKAMALTTDDHNETR